MYIKRKVYSVTYDENGEEKLFSTTEIMSEESYLEKLYSEDELEQKEFNSRAQKLLRRASDYKKAMTGSGRLVSGEANQINKEMNSFGNSGDSFIKQGRKLNQSLGKIVGVNQSINKKAELIGSEANRNRLPHLSKNVRNTRKTASTSRARQDYYDHGGVPYEKHRTEIAKTIMK